MGEAGSLSLCVASTVAAMGEDGDAYNDFKALLALARLKGETGDGDRGNWKGKKPLKGVFPSPQYGYDGSFFGVGEKAEGGFFNKKRAQPEDDISSTSSEDE